jgi:hypothetical protein
VVVFGQSRLENSVSGALKYRFVSETAAFEYPKKILPGVSKRGPISAHSSLGKDRAECPRSESGSSFDPPSTDQGGPSFASFD